MNKQKKEILWEIAIAFLAGIGAIGIYFLGQSQVIKSIWIYFVIVMAIIVIILFTKAIKIMKKE